MLRAAVTLGVVAAALSVPVAAAATGDIERVSVATSGAQGDDDSTAPSISRDGDVVAVKDVARHRTVLVAARESYRVRSSHAPTPPQ